MNLRLTNMQEKLEAVDELTQRVILGFDVLNTTLGRLRRHVLALLAGTSFFALAWLLILGIVQGWLFAIPLVFFVSIAFDTSYNE